MQHQHIPRCDSPIQCTKHRTERLQDDHPFPYSFRAILRWEPLCLNPKGANATETTAQPGWKHYVYWHGKGKRSAMRTRHRRYAFNQTQALKIENKLARKFGYSYTTTSIIPCIMIYWNSGNTNKCTVPQSMYFILLSSYMFRHYRHLQGLCTKHSLKYTAIKVFIINIICRDVSSADCG